MEVTSVEFRKANGNSAIKYYANIRIDGVLELRNFKVIEGKNGLFVAPPSEKSNKTDESGNNVWYDIIRFNTQTNEGKSFRENFSTSVLSELDKQGFSISDKAAKPSKSVGKSSDVPW